jgi:4-amino-4-deoxy-L-arabinose transferase-like glycosyltransferase
VFVTQRMGSAAGFLRRCLLATGFVPCCLVAALAVRLCWVMATGGVPIDDFSWYYDRAVDLSAGRGLTVNGVPTAYWPVGYPLMLAGLFLLTGPSLLAAQLLNVLLGFGIVWFSYRIATRLFVSEPAGRMALLLLALCPNQIAYTSLTASETPFLFLMLLGCLILVRKRRRLRHDALAGVVFGFGCLTKPTMLFVPAVFIGLSLLRRFRWATVARGLAVFGAMGLVILPWSVRNYEVFGRPVFIVTSGGINLLIGNNPMATGGYGHADPLSEELVEAEQEEGAREIVARTIALRYIRAHPWRTLALVPSRLWHLYSKDVEGFYWNELSAGAVEGPVTGRPMFLLKVFAQMYYLALLATFAVGVVSVHVTGSVVSRPVSALGLGLIGYFTLVMLLLFGSSRLHFPTIPCFTWYAGAWLAARVTTVEPRPQECTALSPAIASRVIDMSNR